MYVTVSYEHACFLNGQNNIYDTQLEADKQTLLSCKAGLTRMTVVVRMPLFKSDPRSFAIVGYSSVDPQEYIDLMCYE